MKNIKKILNLILFLGIFISFISAIWKHQDLFKRYNADYFEKKFNKSQWRDPRSEQKISDADLLIYAGAFYLKGGNPILVNIETPLFGKYIIGLFLKLIPYHNLLGIFASTFFLLTVYLFFSKISNCTTSLILLLFLTLDPLLRSHFAGIEFLDMFYTALLFLFFYFTYLFFKNTNNKYLYLSAIFLGLASSTKAFIATWGIGLLSFFVLYFFLKNKIFKMAKSLILFFSLSLLVSLLTYARFFIDKPSLIEWLKVQKWILNFYQIGYQRSFWYNPLSFTFLNRWFVDWQDSYISLSYWYFLWPFTFLAFFYFLFKFVFKVIKKKKVLKIEYLILWPAIYLAFLFYNPYFWPRYLIPLFPFFYFYFYKIIVFVFNLLKSYFKKA